MRESGFYWVWSDSADGWVPAEWDADMTWWHFVGSDVPAGPGTGKDGPAVIGRRIYPPIENDALPSASSCEDRWRVEVYLPDGNRDIWFIDYWNDCGEPIRIDTGCLILEKPDLATHARRAYGPGQWLRYESLLVQKGQRSD